MNARHLLLALLLLAAWPILSFGQNQNKRVSKAHLTEKYGHFSNPDSTLDHRNFFAAMATKMGLPDASAMVLQQEIAGENGFVHFKFQQFHAGLPIVGCTYILHEKGGWVRRANGHFTPNPTAAAIPAISPDRAVNIAEQEMGAKTYARPPAATACFIDPAFPKTSERLRLAFMIDLTSLDPFGKERFYVDALRGKVIARFPLIAEKGVPSTATTRYYGKVGITTDSLGPQSFSLHDPTRGNGITVLDLDLNGFTNSSSVWDLKNDDQDEVALDAHYCSTRFYDMLLGDFGWNGLDGNGAALKAVVHNNYAGNVNAFWDGEYTNYGDGDCRNGPMTTLEVVGHEFMHGVVQFTSALIYNSESGAINESLADIFGKALERKADAANFDWDLGHSFVMAGGEPFRVMDDPKVLGMPAFYGGEFWDASNDVHTNSSIGNLWFTMIVDGKQGVNEAGEQFNVPAIGMDKAARIAFFTNKNYLTASSDYQAFYEGSLATAEEIFGIGAPELQAVEAAWKAVGLPTSNTGGPVFDLSVSTDGFDETVSCTGGVFIPLTIDIVNLGNEPYLPSMDGSLGLSNMALWPYSFDLTEEIQPGEVFSLVVDDWFFPVSPDFYFVNIDLDIDDDMYLNNFDYTYFVLFEHDTPELSVDAQFNDPACFSTEYVADFYVVNNSCAPVPAGTNLELSIQNSIGTVLWATNHPLLEELPAASAERLKYAMPLAVNSNEELTIKLGVANDPDLSNNEILVNSPNFGSISSDYLNKFGNQTQLYDRLKIYSDVSPILANYQGKSYVGSTGIYPDPTVFEPCPNFEDNFGSSNYYGGVNTTLEACVDFSQFQTAVVSFDMIQFRNQSAVDAGSLHSCMLQVKWDGNVSGNQIFFGQPEGQIVHHEFDLPTFFQGGLEIKFYTEVGQGQLAETFFQTDDVILLDNLRLLTNTIGIPETPAPNGISISPNPAHETIEIRAETPLKSLELMSVDGKLMKTQPITDGSTTANLALRGLENGVYFLRIGDATGASTVRRVVKMGE